MAFHTKLITSTSISRSVLFVLAGIFLICLVLLIILAYEILHLKNDVLDSQVMFFFSRHRYPAVVGIMRVITFFGSSFFLLPAYVLLMVYLSLKRFFREVLAVALISFLGWLLLSELKILFHRHRPDLPLVTDITTYSFPSAHAFSSLVFFSILAFVIAKSMAPPVLKKFAVFLFLLFPILIGLSRIILNVHYPTDVLAGYCLGAMWLILSYLAYRKVRFAN